MMKSCVTISLVPTLRKGPWIFWDDLEVSIPKAKRVGFDAVELFTASADAVDADGLAELLATERIGLAAVGTGAGKVLHGLSLTSADADVRRQAHEYITAMIDFGARFGAPAIIGSMQGNVEKDVERAQAFAWLTGSLRTLAEHAAACNVTLIYELLNRYETNLINRLADGVTLLEEAGITNVKLLADLFHMNIEEVSIGDAIRNAGGQIGHVHFADSNRRPVGNGHMDIKSAVAALGDIGYSGYLSAEALPWPDPNRAAEQTMRAFQECTRSNSECSA
ncbi:MAG: sugar phosphate isomerase/epimerase [Sedimentisphaerales bacterium]|nr:sugar phosphate isomerase/epimerase [Sedimentisphaerales bacterium]